MLVAIEWFGSLTGVAGAILLAVNVRISPWAYILFLLSNLSLSLWAFLGNYHGVLAMQGIMAVISLMGIYRWLIHPAYYHKPGQI